METKWIAIGLIGVVAALFSPVTIVAYTNSQCKLGYAHSDKSADEIIKICGK